MQGFCPLFFNTPRNQSASWPRSARSHPAFGGSFSRAAAAVWSPTSPTVMKNPSLWPLASACKFDFMPSLDRPLGRPGWSSCPSLSTAFFSSCDALSDPRAGMLGPMAHACLCQSSPISGWLPQRPSLPQSRQRRLCCPTCALLDRNRLSIVLSPCARRLAQQRLYPWVLTLNLTRCPDLPPLVSASRTTSWRNSGFGLLPLPVELLLVSLRWCSPLNSHKPVGVKPASVLACAIPRPR